MSSILAEVSLVQGGRVVHTETVGGQALFVGRAPDNDIIVSDRVVSGRHVVFYLSEDRSRLLLRDLGSTNGTFVNGQRTAGAVRVANGDEIRLGSTVFLAVRVEERSEPAPPPARPSLVVDLATGLGHPLQGDRFIISSGPEADLQVAEEDFPRACIAVHDDGGVWVTTDETEFPVAVGEPFQLGGRTFILRTDRHALQATVREAVPTTAWSYRLVVSLGGPAGSEARIEDPASGRKHVVTAENRVALLFVLARRRLEDLEAQMSPARAGWCPDEEVMRGIWGKSWENLGTNNYQVLLSRLRSEIRQAGLDGWFIEKRKGHTRVCLDDMTLTNG